MNNLDFFERIDEDEESAVDILSYEQLKAMLETKEKEIHTLKE